MKIGVLVINFGEPAEPTLETVRTYLERIFLQNMSLEHHLSDDAVHRRMRQLAESRAPGLVEEYQAIGGSPLNAQAVVRAQALHGLLEARGWDVRTYAAFQFTEPFIDEVVARARADGVETLVALPVYPLCGHSTTVAALDAVQRSLDDLGWAPEFVAISGWHDEPGYLSMRVDHIRAYLEREGLDLQDPDTILYFSAHGTPVKYLDDGSRYDRYVEEHCRTLARALGHVRYAVGFQNHANRGIVWTRPDNEDRIETLTEKRLVVDAVSFLHEQSETLAELDHELREFVEGLGKEMYRIPVPHDDARVPVLLADLVARALAAHGGESTNLSQCRCRAVADTWCTNGRRDLPPSPYVPEPGEAGRMAAAPSGGHG
jgi:protoporphyrin/coproporphyrin ferrochelatase